MRKFPPYADILDIFERNSPNAKLSFPDISRKYASRLTDAGFGSCVHDLVDSGDLVKTEGGTDAEPLYELASSHRSRLDFYKDEICQYFMELNGDWCKVSHIVAGLGCSHNFSQTALRELCSDGKVVYTGKGLDAHYYWKADASTVIAEAFEEYIRARDVLSNM